MSYAIIGFGNVGHALARAFARNGIEVSVATTRDPESFAADAKPIGPTIIPEKLADAIEADIVFLAIRFESHRDVAKALPNWQGKTIVDVTNAYRVSPEELGGRPSSKAVAQACSGEFLAGGQKAGTHNFNLGYLPTSGRDETYLKTSRFDAPKRTEYITPRMRINKRASRRWIAAGLVTRIEAPRCGKCFTISYINDTPAAHRHFGRTERARNHRHG